MECKLIGTFVQHLEVTLSPGEEFYAEKGSLIYIENGIEKEVSVNGSGLTRIISAKLAGESLFIVRYYNPTGQSQKIVFGGRHSLVPVKIAGEELVCHRGVYVASNNRVSVSTKLSISGLVGGMGLMLQKISGTSTVFLDSNGTPLTIDIPSGHWIDVDENHIIAIQGIPENRMQAQWSLSNFISGEGLSLLRLGGPGRVYLSPGSFLSAELSKL